jgi:membrane-associated phospholipid phosphatase
MKLQLRFPHGSDHRLWFSDTTRSWQYSFYMIFLTDFADQAVILPLALAVGAALALAGWRRGAFAWLLAVPATLGVVLLAKMTVVACGHLIPVHGLRSPSGHTASAAVAYGGLLALLVPRGTGPAPTGIRALLLGAIFALLFGFTRLALEVHTRADVVVGALIGVAGALCLAQLAGDRPARMRAGIPVGAALIVVLLFHGAHLRAEDQIDHVSRIVWPLTLCLPAG